MRSFARLIAFFLTIATINSIAFADGSAPSSGSYTGMFGRYHVNFTLTAGAVSDRIRGEIVIPRGNSTFTGRYNGKLNSFTGRLTNSHGRKRRILGSYDSGARTFFFRIRATRHRVLSFRCKFESRVVPSNPGFLTGTWLINENIIMIVKLTETPSGGDLSGSGQFAVKGFSLSGAHASVDSILVTFISPDNLVDTIYTLQLCASGNTMIGHTNEQIIDNTAVWCRKPAGFKDGRGVCPEDKSCPYDPYA